jgi:hypothetical protein
MLSNLLALKTVSILLISIIYKLSKAFYGLKQAPRASYECLRVLIANGFVGISTPGGPWTDE